MSDEPNNPYRTSTQDDLHQAFLNFSTQYLKATEGSEVDSKVFESIYKYLDKKEFATAPTPSAGSYEEGALAKVKKKHGIDDE